MTTETKRPVPRKLNNSMIQAMAEAIRNGNYPTVAATLCGIDENTWRRWLALGEADSLEGIDSIYSTLFKELKQAEGEAEAEMVAVIRESATVKREWLPAMVYLERRHRERWGRPAPVQIQQETKIIAITRVEVVLDKSSAPQIIEGAARELIEAPKPDTDKLT